MPQCVKRERKGEGNGFRASWKPKPWGPIRTTINAGFMVVNGPQKIARAIAVGEGNGICYHVSLLWSKSVFRRVSNRSDKTSEFA